MEASPAVNDYHAVLSMLLTVPPRLVSHEIKFGRLVQEAWEQRLALTSTMPSPACCLQYAFVLLLSVLNVDRFVQEACEIAIIAKGSRGGETPEGAPQMRWTGQRYLHQPFVRGSSNTI